MNKELKDYTTDELRAEISRRYKEKKAADALKPRCRNCANVILDGPYLGMWGRCRVRTYVRKGRTYYYCVSPSGHCEKFEPKE